MPVEFVAERIPTTTAVSANGGVRNLHPTAVELIRRLTGDRTNGNVKKNISKFRIGGRMNLFPTKWAGYSRLEIGPSRATQLVHDMIM